MRRAGNRCVRTSGVSPSAIEGEARRERRWLLLDRRGSRAGRASALLDPEPEEEVRDGQIQWPGRATSDGAELGACDGAALPDVVLSECELGSG
jgi:hypothetical protein